MALGAWGAVQAVRSSGLSRSFFGGALRDIVSTPGDARRRSARRWPIPVPPGYSAVYHVEMLLLFVTLVAIGPLVGPIGRRPTAHPTPRPSSAWPNCRASLTPEESSSMEIGAITQLRRPSPAPALSRSGCSSQGSFTTSCARGPSRGLSDGDRRPGRPHGAARLAHSFSEDLQAGTDGSSVVIGARSQAGASRRCTAVRDRLTQYIGAADRARG